jgi:hypothetical protein
MWKILSKIPLIPARMTKTVAPNNRERQYHHFASRPSIVRGKKLPRNARGKRVWFFRQICQGKQQSFGRLFINEWKMRLIGRKKREDFQGYKTSGNVVDGNV